MRLLFITRTYPPAVGGMERFASDFYHYYAKLGKVDLLANSGGRIALLPFLLRTVFSLVANANKYDVVHLYDAVLSPLVPIIRLSPHAKVSLTVNGLDIVYARFGYQRIVPFFLKKAHRVVAISEQTKRACLARGIPAGKLTVIPVGVSHDHLESCPEAARAAIMSKFNITPRGPKILLTVGRLVKRKGHAWFISQVLTQLPEDYLYVIAGAGPEREPILRLVRDLTLGHRVRLLGAVSEAERNCLYQIAHLFVMPNVTIPGDQEGFGMVALEAGLYGLPVIASNIEGIGDAVIDHETGRLIKEMDVDGFLDAIVNSGFDRAALPRLVAAKFGWSHIVARYHAMFAELQQGKREVPEI